MRYPRWQRTIGASSFLLVLAWNTALVGRCSPSPAEQNLYSFSLVRPGGKEVSLADYKGKVVIIVNLASKSTFAEQLPALQKLQEQYKDQGLTVLGVPSNDFGSEEPGDDSEIQKYYAAAHVTFPVMAKSVVCGKDKLPLYAFLTSPAVTAKSKEKEPGKAPSAQIVPGDDVHWSFTKFILTRDGQVGARFEPDVAPDSPEFQIAVEKALAGKLKLKSKAPAGADGAVGGDEDDDGGL